MKQRWLMEPLTGAAILVSRSITSHLLMPFVMYAIKGPFNARTAAPQILIRFSKHDFRAENAVRIMGIAASRIMAADAPEMARTNPTFYEQRRN